MKVFKVILAVTISLILAFCIYLSCNDDDFAVVTRKGTISNEQVVTFVDGEEQVVEQKAIYLVVLKKTDEKEYVKQVDSTKYEGVKVLDIVNYKDY